jgi:hypothetical protein
VKVARLLLLLAFVSLVAPMARAQLLEQVDASKHRRPLGKAWDKNGQTADITLPFPNVTRKPASIRIGKQNPHGVRVTFVRGDGNQVLPLNFGKEFRGLTPDGDLAADYVLHAGTFDFDRDGTPEVVVVVGDTLTDLAVNVFRLNTKKQFVRVGTFEGQQKAILEGNAVVLPYGSKGLFFEYRWKNGKFIQTQD